MKWLLRPYGKHVRCELDKALFILLLLNCVNFNKLPFAHLLPLIDYHVFELQ